MPCQKPRPALPPQDHGGNLREAQSALGVAHLHDFSASINPLGQPEGLQEAVFSAWHEVSRYPDRSCSALRRDLGRHLGVPADSILMGNGSAELIDLLLRHRSNGRLILAPPDFGLYEELVPAGRTVVRVPRQEEDGFLPDLEPMQRAVRAGDQVLFSNPCNPSGRYAPRSALEPLSRACAEAGAQLILDEAFADFQPLSTWVEAAATQEHLVVLRSMTKFYAIPGLRLGYLVSPPEQTASLRARQVPWSVNALAQEAGRFCLRQPDWERRTIAAVTELRDSFAAELSSLPGVTPLPSVVNYLLLRLTPPAPSARELYSGLAQRGFLVRHCRSFGLGERYLRLAVRTRSENDQLLDALRALLAEAGEPPEVT